MMILKVEIQILLIFHVHLLKVCVDIMFFFVYCIDDYKQFIVASVKPMIGRALIFNHDTRHEGEQVSKGVKYIMRTEIMFKRTSGAPSADWRTDEGYKE